MKTVFPIDAIPAATPAKFCSDTPTWTNRSGYFSANQWVLVLSDTSAVITQKFGFSAPISTNAFPKPSRLGFLSWGASMFLIRLMSGLIFEVVTGLLSESFSSKTSHHFRLGFHRIFFPSQGLLALLLLLCRQVIFRATQL